MKNSIFNIVASVLTALTAPVAQTNIKTNPGIASNYFDANWALFNTDSQPYQPASSGSNKYTDEPGYDTENRSRTMNMIKTVCHCFSSALCVLLALFTAISITVMSLYWNGALLFLFGN